MKVKGEGARTGGGGGRVRVGGGQGGGGEEVTVVTSPWRTGAGEGGIRYRVCPGPRCAGVRCLLPLWLVMGSTCAHTERMKRKAEENDDERKTGQGVAGGGGGGGGRW